MNQTDFSDTNLESVCGAHPTELHSGLKAALRESFNLQFTIDDLGFGGENSYSISECGVKNNGKWTKSNKFAAGRL
jgi:hypothetical protein